MLRDDDYYKFMLPLFGASRFHFPPFEKRYFLSASMYNVCETSMWHLHTRNFELWTIPAFPLRQMFAFIQPSLPKKQTEKEQQAINIIFSHLFAASGGNKYFISSTYITDAEMIM